MSKALGPDREYVTADVNRIGNEQAAQLYPGTLQTAIPISPAAFTSTLSKPLPTLTMTRRLLNFSKSSLLRVIEYHIRAPTASVNTCSKNLVG